jgi:alpha-glucosidase
VASLASAELSWLPTGDGVIGFGRGEDFVCVANTSDHAVDLPPHDSVLLSSIPLVDDRLPSDAAVWLKTV